MASTAPVELTIDVRTARPLAPTVEVHHVDTVMDLCVAGDAVATIDFAGNWAVWRCADLQQVAGGALAGRVGRRVALAPDGARIAVLTGSAGIDFRWHAAIIDIVTGVVVPFGSGDFRRLAWTEAGLFAMGPLGYRVYDPAGSLRLDGHHQPQPGSAWMASAVTRDGTRAYAMSHHRLAGFAFADRNELPAPDLTPFERPAGHAAWAFPDLALSDDGLLLALGFLDEMLLWRMPGCELLARITPTGVQITHARVRFSGDRLITCFTHVHADGGQRKTVATFDPAAREVTDVVSTGPQVHGGKGGADGALLVAHGPVLSRALLR
ncbi:MAG: hypothetical protein K8M05_27700 [Deltaproteobacteria bacterium]|nr:hypothetical protein [Kofleriaceae bacterium]